MRTRVNAIVIVLLAIALGWAGWIGFIRGGQDFQVFHYAASLVWQGRWDALYSEGPDRFLYAPGFALLLSPLTLLPLKAGLAIWLLATLTGFGAALFALSKRLGLVPVALAVLFSMRSVAIDLRYGQVNLLILSAAIFALLSWAEREDTRASRKRIAITWFFFSMAAFSKIYPLALFLFPAAALFREPLNRRAAYSAYAGALVGALVLFVPPLFVSGIYLEWFDALARKGLPTYTHNQSLPAFLVRFFGGEPFAVLGLGGQLLKFEGLMLLPSTIRLIWYGFAFFGFGVLGWVAWRAARKRETVAIAEWIGLSLCFLPAHLIWKAYFVLGIPLLAVLFSEAGRNEPLRKKLIPAAALAGIFLAFTSRDFVGPNAAAWIEACSPFFWIHVGVTIVGSAWLFSRPEQLRRSS